MKKASPHARWWRAEQGSSRLDAVDAYDDRMHPTGRQTSRVIAAMVVVGVVLVGIGWSLASPPGSAPDDDYHLTSIWCPPPIEQSGCVLRDDGNGTIGVLVPRIVRDAGECFAFHAEVSAACMASIPNDWVVSTRVDKGAYPPHFFRFMHLFSGADVTASVVLMRLVNLGLVLLLGIAALVASRPAARVRWGIALTCSLVPLGLFVVFSINPSSWSIMGIALLALSLEAMLVSQRPRSVLIGAGVSIMSALMAAGARVDSAAYVPITVVAMCLLHGFRSDLRIPRIAIATSCAAIGVASYLGTRGIVESVSDFGRTQGMSEFQIFYRNVLDYPAYFVRMFSFLGNLDTIMPPLVSLTAAAAAVGLLLLGLAALNLRKALAILVVAVPFVSLPLFMAQQAHQLLRYEDFPQPRYLLPLLGVLIFVGLTPSPQPFSFSWVQVTLVSSVMVGVHSLALFTNIRRYTNGVGEGSASAIEWWWEMSPGPLVVWGVGSLGFALAMAGLAMHIDGVLKGDITSSDRSPGATSA